MGVEMIRDFTGRGETGTSRISQRPVAGQELGAPPEKPEFSALVMNTTEDHGKKSNCVIRASVLFAFAGPQGRALPQTPKPGLVRA